MWRVLLSPFVPGPSQRAFSGAMPRFRRSRPSLSPPVRVEGPRPAKCYWSSRRLEVPTPPCAPARRGHSPLPWTTTIPGQRYGLAVTRSALLSLSLTTDSCRSQQEGRSGHVAATSRTVCAIDGGLPFQARSTGRRRLVCSNLTDRQAPLRSGRDPKAHNAINVSRRGTPPSRPMNPPWFWTARRT